MEMECVLSMAKFTNYATLSYNGGSTDSNTVTGELLEVLTVTKAPVLAEYTAAGRVTYVVSLVNSGPAAMTGLTMTDDLGGYLLGEETLYPLSYAAGSLKQYVNGVQQTAPEVTAGPPLSISGVSVPAGGSTVLIYEAEVTDYAPLGVEASVTNTVTVTGDGLANPVTASATVNMTNGTDLRVSKAVCPAAVTENGELTYTFVIENHGSLAAAEEDDVVLTDTFRPRLHGLTATLNGTLLQEGTDYTYQEETGVFTTLAGKLTVPAAAYAQTAEGTWTVTPGTATLVIRGTV